MDDEDNEVVMPRSTKSRRLFKKGDTVKAVVAAVELRNNNPRIILSRTAPEFLERLFEMEVPEIYDGLITIKKIVRAPGERAKVAVESYDDRVDPVGACVGMKGSRIHSIVRELRNENIDVINFTENEELLVQRALSPAKVTSMALHSDTGKAEVYLKPDQVSLAIGKGGNNIKLAGLLTGYDIDVYREDDEVSEDVEIEGVCRRNRRVDPRRVHQDWLRHRPLCPQLGGRRFGEAHRLGGGNHPRGDFHPEGGAGRVRVIQGAPRTTCQSLRPHAPPRFILSPRNHPKWPNQPNPYA